ncbi:MAG: UDP-glucose 4-epimerase GalE [Actinomycetota bacterium]|jgi:nucleoside-diphosphate-sugar epimerase
MTVLVSGGAGYIGSHTVRQLRSLGRDVVVLDSLDTGHAQAVLDAPLIVGNIADAELVNQVCGDHKVTSVVHFAAHKAVGESMQNPAKYWRNNVDGSARFVDALLHAGVKQFVFSSSCSVYGTPAVVPVSEAAPIDPESVYAETKAMTERVLRWYGVTSGLRSVSLRYFNAAGASLDNAIGEDWTHSANLIPVVMKAAMGMAPAVQIFGTDYPTPDGTAIRDYIHVEDLANAHVLSLAYLADGGDTIALNVGTGVGSSVFDVVHATERIGKVTVPTTLAPRRAGDPVSTYSDPTLVRSTLGWTPEHSLDTIIETAWRWHSTHPNGYAT